MTDRLHEVLVVRLKGLGLTPPLLLSRDGPVGPGAPGSTSANGTCRLIAARDGWIALNLARSDDLDLIPALTGQAGDPWDAVTVAVGKSLAREFRDRAAELQLPVAVLGESEPQPLAAMDRCAVPKRVVDLSALWAGPLCAGLLAHAGAEVLRIESVGRPDPTPLTTPLLDARINSGKKKLSVDLRTGDGRAQLMDELALADVLVTSARPMALARLGLEPGKFPNLTWVAITAHGFTGAGAMRVGFGDDCAVAGGLVRWENDAPLFRGDALADPLTGLEAALAVLSGQRGLIDMALSRVAAAYARILS